MSSAHTEPTKSLMAAMHESPPLVFFICSFILFAGAKAISFSSPLRPPVSPAAARAAQTSLRAASNVNLSCATSGLHTKQLSPSDTASAA